MTLSTRSLSRAVSISALLITSTSTFVSAQPAVIERQVAVQGSVGQPGRELAFLNCQNLDQVEVFVGVQFIPNAPETGAGRFYAFPPEARVSINIGLDVPELLPASNFSIVVYAEAADALPVSLACDVTWHRASDNKEVESRPLVVRSSPKR